MKKNSIYNLEVITEQDVFNAFRSEFKDVGRVSSLSHDMGDGESATYAQIHLGDDFTVALYDDAQILAFQNGGKEVISVAWNEATEALLRDPAALTALATLAANVEEL
ncbi:hypothetical protein [Planococcus beigongshangi]|uniref:hypothetical protein n=1 Tax=Planococcus beigongshangi TaxID=2782536 RepID=UPI00193BC55B|nr:hypothetical protein [Planococcus beigongshangi]